jgi:ATP-dependent exoDNAse (exonuclease V) beta subunit
LGLREFVQALRELEEEPPRLAEWSSEEEGAEQVRLLTVHMAKGLEFPFVVLVNLASRGHPQQAPLVYDRGRERVEVRLRASDVRTNLSTSGFDEVAETERARERAEERRLLYVAATRARDYLAVAAFHGARVEGLLKTLRQATGALGEAELPELGAAVRPASAAPDSRASWCVVSSAELEPQPREEKPRLDRADVATLLSGRGTWEMDDARRRQRAASRVSLLSTDPHLRATDRGSTDTESVDRLTHAVLEHVSPDLDSTEFEVRVREAAERCAASEVVPLAMRARSDEIHDRAARARRVWRGVQLVGKVGSHLVESRLDLILEDADSCTLIDFTTREAGADEDVERQRNLALRALVLAGTGVSVREAGTFFLRDGRYLPLLGLDEWMRRVREELESVSS